MSTGFIGVFRSAISYMDLTDLRELYNVNCLLNVFRKFFSEVNYLALRNIHAHLD